MSSTVSSWYGKYYSTKAIQEMPRFCFAKNGTRQLEIDFAGQEDEMACLEMIEDSAKRGDNVSVDEYPHPRDILFASQVFVAKDLKLKRLDSFIVICPSWYARSYDHCLVGIYIYRSKDLESDGAIFEQLLRLAVDLSRELELGYTNAIFSVASCLNEMVDALTREGFVRMATIPDGVRIAGVGLCDNFFMVKKLSLLKRQKRPKEELLQMIERFSPEEYCNQVFNDALLPRADFLPIRYTFASGLAINCRNIEKCEDQVLYNILKSVASQGLGYGVDEIPTFGIFKTSMLLDHYCVVFEEVTTKKILGMTFITTSWYSRCKAERFGESSLFITEEFRGRNLGAELIIVDLAIMKQLGFRASLNDALASNGRMMTALRKTRYAWKEVGIIPDGCYTEGYGWDDQVITFFDFRNNPDVKDLTELVKETKRNRKASITTFSKL